MLIQSHFQCYARHKALAARKTIDVTPSLPFHGTSNNFSDMFQYLPKHIFIAYAEFPLPTIYHRQQTPSNPATKRTSEKHKSGTSSTKTRATDSNDTVRVVHYKGPVDRATQIERHADIQNKNTERLVHGWRQDIGIVYKYGSYQTRFLCMLSDFYHIRAARPECINTAEHRIKLLKPSTRPLHSALYRVGPGICKFERAEINKMLNESIIEHAQTKCASPIAFSLKKDGTF